MKNWQIILWLILFFPVGIYLMFMYSDWKKPVKYGTTGFLILLMFVGGVEFWASLFFLGAFIAILIGLFSVFRKKSRRRGFITLGIGLLMVTATYPIVGAQTAEFERLAQIELEAEAEADRMAEEERLEEIARKEEEQRRVEEEKRLEEEKQLKEEISEAIEVVEEYPTQKNYDVALKLLDQLDTEDRILVARLEEVLPEVEDYEKKVALAEEAVEKAEEEKDRETYNAAFELVAALPVSNKTLTRQLSKLDEEILKIEEEERLAAEKAAEEERKAAEKAAEEERIAAEKAAEEERKAAKKVAEEQKIAAEQAAKKQAEANAQQSSASSSNSGNSNSTGSVSQATAPAPVSAPGQYVDANGNGLIKGSSSGIYHTPGSTYYNKTTKPVAWFKTVQDAVNAGYRAPKR